MSKKETPTATPIPLSSKEFEDLRRMTSLEARVVDAEAQCANLERELERTRAALHSQTKHAATPTQPGPSAAAKPRASDIKNAASVLESPLMDELSQTFVELARCGSIEEINLLVAQRTFDLNPEAYVVVSLVDPSTSQITIRKLLGFGPIADTVLKTLGRDPRRMSFHPDDMSPDERRRFASGRLEEVPDGVYGLLTRKVPRAACQTVEHLLSIDGVFSVGFSLDEVPQGGITVLKKKGVALRSVPFIESLAAQISLAIRYRQSEEALRESEERYRLLTETSRDLIVLHDMKGKILFVNLSVQTNTGYTEDELLGHSVLEFIPPKHHEVISRNRESRQKNPTDQHLFEIEILKKNGGAIPLEIRSNAVTRGDEPLGVLIAGTDITERQRAERRQAKLERQLRKSQKMESIGRLAGGVAHDFNNLLTVIRGVSDFLLLSFDRGDPRRRDTEELVKAAETAANLTAQLLAFSRKQVVTPKVIDVHDSLKRSENMLERLLGETIELEVLGGRHLWPVSIDPSQLDHALVNLAINARDAMPHGGKLTVKAKNVELRERICHTCVEPLSGPHVEIAVSDTGQGIDKKFLTEVFEPFFTTKDQGSGTGLGLSTVHGIIHQASGHLSLFSVPERGTTIKLFLPRTFEAQTASQKNASEPTTHLPQPPQPQLEPEQQPLNQPHPIKTAGTRPTQAPSGRTKQESPPEPTPKDRPTILAAEDQDMLRRFVSRILSSKGYEILTAENGEEALQIIAGREDELDLLLTDVVMPKMGGKQLAETLRQRRPDLPVLYMSGYTENSTELLDLDSENTGFMDKPFEAQQLLDRIQALLKNKACAEEDQDR